MLFKRRTGQNQAERAVVDSGIGTQTLAFLSSQNLGPTPEHYALGYAYLTERDSLAAKAVDAVTMNGVKLTSEQAAHILSAHRAGKLPVVAQDEEDPNCIRLRHQTLHLAELTALAVATTEQFGRDLSSELAALGREGLPVATVVSDMIMRSADAERALAGAALEIDMLRHEVAVAKGDAQKDALTGLLNRRGLEAEIQAIGRENAVIAMCDIDRFKTINDRWGHPIGDRILKAVASVINDECSPHVVARWGGEEFVIVMQGIPIARASAIIERANATLAKRTFRVRETDEPVGTITLSAGLVSAAGQDIDAAIAQADALMYEAKRAGRNRIICQEPHIALAA